MKAATLPVSASWRALGTTCLVAVTEPDDLPLAREILATVLDEGDRTMSRFRPDSELCRIQAGVATETSPVLAGAIAVALQSAEATGGLVDPTIGRAMVAAGYDRDFADLCRLPAPPSPTSIALTAPAPGWRVIDFDPRTATVTVPAGVTLDLGATGKAYLADLAARRITATTGGGVLVSLGGDVSVAGQPPQGGWSVRVAEDPDDREALGPGQTIGLEVGGLATSSTLLRTWRHSDRTMHHVLDPATGAPARVVWRTVSVAAATCVDANTASTAAIVLGERAPDWLAASRLPSRLVGADGDVLTLAGWPEATP